MLSSTESAVIEQVRATEAVAERSVIPATDPPLFSIASGRIHHNRMVSRFGSSEQQVHRSKKTVLLTQLFSNRKSGISQAKDKQIWSGFFIARPRVRH